MKNIEIFSLDPQSVIGIDGIKLPEPEFDESGFLRIWGSPARVGWLQYMLPDGSDRWERVDRDVLEDPEHLKTLTTPVTRGHPAGSMLLTPDSVKEYTVGNCVGQPYFDPDSQAIHAKFLITAREAIDAIQSGEVELSCGYWKVIEPISDVLHGENTYRQVSRRNNHHAFIPVGTARAGREARLFTGDSIASDLPILIGYDTIDSRTHFDIKGNQMTKEQEEKAVDAKPILPTISVDGKVFTGVDITNLQEQLTQLTTALAEKEAALTGLQAEHKKTKATVDSLTAEVAQIPQLVIQSRKTLGEAEGIISKLPDGVFNADTLSTLQELEVKKAVCIATGAIDEKTLEARHTAIKLQKNEIAADAAIELLVDTKFAELVAEYAQKSVKQESVTAADQRQYLQYVTRRTEEKPQKASVAERRARRASEVRQQVKAS